MRDIAGFWQGYDNDWQKNTYGMSWIFIKQGTSLPNVGAILRKAGMIPHNKWQSSNVLCLSFTAFMPSFTRFHAMRRGKCADHTRFSATTYPNRVKG